MIADLFNPRKDGNLVSYVQCDGWKVEDPLFSNFMALLLVLEYDFSPTDALVAMGLLEKTDVSVARNQRKALKAKQRRANARKENH